MSEPHLAPYSTRTRVALAIARAVAAARGERDLTSLHLLLGLLREGENAAVAALHYQGVALATLRHECERELGAPPGGTEPDTVVLPPSPGEARLVAAARVAAAALEDEHIGPQHLLLAILGESGSPAAALLAQHGITTEGTKATYEKIIHKH